MTGKLILSSIILAFSLSAGIAQSGGKTVSMPTEACIVDIIPFKGISPKIIDHVFSGLKEICPAVVLKEAIPYPKNAWYQPRKRYRADSLISHLSQITPVGHVSVGLAGSDISTTKDPYQDWGVMGLGYMPGNACVASTFRLNRKKLEEQFFKTVIHELGHTQGLDHCPDRKCFMQDAEGRNKTDRETEFCPRCRAVLTERGWKLNR